MAALADFHTFKYELGIIPRQAAAPSPIFAAVLSSVDSANATQPGYDAAKANRVFISHGKQREIVNQVKELLQFGNFDPVVSVERESTAHIVVSLCGGRQRTSQ